MTNPCYTSSISGVCWHAYILYTSTRVYNVVSRISLVNSQYTLLKQTSIPVQSSSSYSECILIFSPSKGSDKSLFWESLISSEWMTMLHVHIHFIRNWFPSMFVNDHLSISPHLPSQSNLPMWFPATTSRTWRRKSARLMRMPPRFLMGRWVSQKLNDWKLEKGIKMNTLLETNIVCEIDHPWPSQKATIHFQVQTAGFRECKKWWVFSAFSQKRGLPNLKPPRFSPKDFRDSQATAAKKATLDANTVDVDDCWGPRDPWWMRSQVFCGKRRWFLRDYLLSIIP